MSVHSWGTGKLGELGAGEHQEALDPLLLEYFRGKRICSVSCGEQHSLAVTDTGDVYVWGRVREGQLGNGERMPFVSLPTQVWTLRHERVTIATCGWYHNMVVTQSGNVYQWGKLFKYDEDAKTREYFGMAVRLSGLGEDTQREQTKQMLDRSLHQYYAADSNPEDWKESQQVQNFGRFTPYLQSTPELVRWPFGPGQKRRITSIAAGYSFSIAVTDQGEVYAWGFNDKCQLGLGHRYSQPIPQRITSLANVRIVAAACGQQHTVLLSDQGELWSFGLGVFGQLGHGQIHSESRPRRIESLMPPEEGYPERQGERIVQVACGSHHTLALGVSGVVWTWGSAEYGQQGGTNAYEDWATERAGKSAMLVNSTPRRLAGAFHGKHVCKITCGHLYNVALTVDGGVWTWGWGSYGVLGHGNHRFQLVPKQIRRLGGEQITFVSAGSKHCLAVNAGSSTTYAFDFKLALNNPKFSDLTFVCEGKRFYAHKAIVFPRSWYLKAMVLLSSRFRPVSKLEGEEQSDAASSTKAQEEEVIAIKGMRHQIFAAILFYLYTDHLRVAPHMVEAVLKVARRYRLERLQGLCQSLLLTEEEAQTFKPPPSAFHDDMLDALASAETADVVFQLTNNTDEEGKESTPTVTNIYAHRIILSSRSDYFKRIFMGSFKESCDGLNLITSQKGGSYKKHQQLVTVPIEDMSPKIFIAMLEYIYAGRVSSSSPSSTEAKPIQSAKGKEKEKEKEQEKENEDEETEAAPSEYNIRGDIVVELLMAADRFLLDDLKKICEAEIEKSLDMDNICYVLELSDRTSAPRLKRVCHETIPTYWRLGWKSFVESKPCQDLKASAPHLLQELEPLFGATELQKKEEEKEKEKEKQVEEADEDSPPPLVSASSS